ncbi:MAG: N-carbamoyl-D-amino-acid hydrolase [Alphaproteobacteria bacterium]|nr:N-carbamoyl-D-amino-acid hydrolase [Alphaproteobacteria bacterium]
MARMLRVAAGQLGPIQLKDTRKQAVERLLALMRQAAAEGAKLIVFPELALTTFFPRWFMESQAEIDEYFEREMPGPETMPLFDEAKRLGIGFYLGYAELTVEEEKIRRYNAAVLVGADGKIAGKYRKVHLPGSEELRPALKWQQLEKRYFEYGNLGLPVFRAFGGIVGMAICNDRRWPETFRVMGLQGVELVTIGYNSAAHDPNGGDESEALRVFHSNLAAQAGAYQNATWVVAVAKAGIEDGAGLIGSSVIVDPNGRIVEQAKTKEDELLVHDCDLDLCKHGKENMFAFARHRRPQHYGIITAQAGITPPPEE